jgi:hypothetical protein
MAKQPQQSPLQVTTAATIEALTDKINRLESGGGEGSTKGGGKSYISNGKDSKRANRRWGNDNYCWTYEFEQSILLEQ